MCTILRLLYGMPEQEIFESDLVEFLDYFLTNGLRAMPPGSYLLNLFPWMVSLPDWMVPGKRLGKQFHKICGTRFEQLYNQAHSRSASIFCVICQCP